MQKTEQPFTTSETKIPVSEMSCHVDRWLKACKRSQHASKTIEARRLTMNKFLWFLHENNYTFCGLCEIESFFDYLDVAHERPNGRWNNPHQNRPLKPVTIQTYQRRLKAFFNCLTRYELIPSSPMRKITPVIARPDQIQPLTDSQLEGLLKAAKAFKNRRRDEALLLLMLVQHAWHMA